MARTVGSMVSPGTAQIFIATVALAALTKDTSKESILLVLVAIGLIAVISLLERYLSQRETIKTKEQQTQTWCMHDDQPKIRLPKEVFITKSGGKFHLDAICGGLDASFKAGNKPIKLDKCEKCCSRFEYIEPPSYLV